MSSHYVCMGAASGLDCFPSANCRHGDVVPARSVRMPRNWYLAKPIKLEYSYRRRTYRYGRTLAYVWCWMNTAGVYGGDRGLIDGENRKYPRGNTYEPLNLCLDCAMCRRIDRLGCSADKGPGIGRERPRCAGRIVRLDRWG